MGFSLRTGSAGAFDNMGLYAVNCVRLNCVRPSDVRWFGIVVRADSREEADQVCAAQNPDMIVAKVLDYCPVWLRDWETTNFAWRLLRGPSEMRLHPFDDKGGFELPTFRVAVLVREFATYYDPFKLSSWVWGVPVTPADVAKHVNGQAGASYDWTNISNHVVRIANIVVNGFPHPQDPIELMHYPYLPAQGRLGVAVRNGHHRFCAAILRGDVVMEAICTYEVRERMREYGLVRE